MLSANFQKVKLELSRRILVTCKSDRAFSLLTNVVYLFAHEGEGAEVHAAFLLTGSNLTLGENHATALQRPLRSFQLGEESLLLGNERPSPRSF